jgi:hypothetical protein
MNDPVRYGEFDSEKSAEENNACRQIVKEINNFGINERQRMFIIYLLGLELENTEHMRQVTTMARELGKERDMFLTDKSEEEESNGTINT